MCENLPSSNQSDKVDFLLKEYETLRALRQDLIDKGDTRFNFFIAILSGTAVFLSWLSGQPGTNSVVMGMIILGVLLLGLTILARIAARNSSIILYDRGMNRIRMYFLQHYPDIRDYVILEGYDDRPSFRSVTFAEQLPIMLALLNGLVAGAALSGLASAGSGWETALHAITGLAVFAGMFAAQIWYYNVAMRRGVAGLEVKFRKS